MKVLAAVIATLLVASVSAAGAASLITGRQVKDSSLTGKDIKNRSVTQRDIRGPLLVSGNRGHVVSVEGDVPAGGIDIFSADCNPGESVVSGGWFTTGEAFVDKTYDDASWSVGVDNFDSSFPASYQVQAWCVPTGDLVAAKGDAARASEIRRDIATRRNAR